MATAAVAAAAAPATRHTRASPSAETAAPGRNTGAVVAPPPAPPEWRVRAPPPSVTSQPTVPRGSPAERRCARLIAGPHQRVVRGRGGTPTCSSVRCTRKGAVCPRRRPSPGQLSRQRSHHQTPSVRRRRRSVLTAAARTSRRRRLLPGDGHHRTRRWWSVSRQDDRVQRRRNQQCRRPRPQRCRVSTSPDPHQKKKENTAIHQGARTGRRARNPGRPDGAAVVGGALKVTHPGGTTRAGGRRSLRWV